VVEAGPVAAGKLRTGWSAAGGPQLPPLLLTAVSRDAKLPPESNPGVDVMIKIFDDFRQISAIFDNFRRFWTIFRRFLTILGDFRQF
jgi:hypothetical protein